jgi:type II secretory pathway pseudopilin PulG
MSHAATRPARRPSAFTLIEVVLVLSLLIIISAVAVPYLSGSFSRANLSGAADLLRSALTRGRVAAIESGQPQVFRCEPKGGRFQLQALEELSDTGDTAMNNERSPRSEGQSNSDEESSAENSTDEHSPSDILRLESSRLPSDVIFAALDVSASNRAVAMYGVAGDDTWSAPIVFNPDGTTSDASILLQNDREQTIRVNLRGLTGIATTGEIGNEEVP